MFTALLLLGLLLNRGFQRLVRTFLEIRNKKQQIEYLRRENDYLKSEIFRLKNDPQYQERMVRKELGYIQPGEIEYRIKEPK